MLLKEVPAMKTQLKMFAQQVNENLKCEWGYNHPENITKINGNWFKSNVNKRVAYIELL